MMKKRTTVGFALLFCAGLLCGCSTSKGAEEATTEAKQETAIDYGQGLNEDGTLADVDPADYVTLCDYSAIEITKDDIAVADSDVQTQIDSLMQNYQTTNQITDRPVKDGDVVNIDYVGTVDGKEFDGGSAQGYDLTIGSGTFIDGFEDQLIDHTPGEKMEVKVTFPEDYSSEELAGKAAVFATTINYISETQDPELTDDFVKENLKDSYGYTSVKDMKKQMKDGMIDDKKADFIWNYMLENCTFKQIPEELVNGRIDVSVEGLKAELTAEGYSLEDYLSAYGYEDEEALRSAFFTTCENTEKIFMIADLVAKEQNISVTDQDISDYFGTENFETYTEYYTKSYINRVVLNDVVLKSLKKTAVIK